MSSPWHFRFFNNVPIVPVIESILHVPTHHLFLFPSNFFQLYAVYPAKSIYFVYPFDFLSKMQNWFSTVLPIEYEIMLLLLSLKWSYPSSIFLPTFLLTFSWAAWVTFKSWVTLLGSIDTQPIRSHLNITIGLLGKIFGDGETSGFNELVTVKSCVAKQCHFNR